MGMLAACCPSWRVAGYRAVAGLPNQAGRNEFAVTNPFEDADTLYLVLVNDEGQHSLWPEGVAVPAGWVAVHQTDSRTKCLEYVDAHWADLRPLSLVRAEQA